VSSEQDLPPKIKIHGKRLTLGHCWANAVTSEKDPSIEGDLIRSTLLRHALRPSVSGAIHAPFSFLLFCLAFDTPRLLAGQPVPLLSVALLEKRVWVGLWTTVDALYSTIYNLTAIANSQVVVKL